MNLSEAYNTPLPGERRKPRRQVPTSTNYSSDWGTSPRVPKINSPSPARTPRPHTPGTMSLHPIATKAGGVGLGLLALSHAKNSLDSMRYGDMTTAALNAGVAGAAGYGAYHMLMGSHREIGTALQNKALTPMLHGLRSMRGQYSGNIQAQKNIDNWSQGIRKVGRTLGKFFA